MEKNNRRRVLEVSFYNQDVKGSLATEQCLSCTFYFYPTCCHLHSNPLYLSNSGKLFVLMTEVNI